MARARARLGTWLVLLGVCTSACNAFDDPPDGDGIPTFDSRGGAGIGAVSTMPRGDLAPGNLSRCGNGVLDFGEQCDGSELDGESCESLAFESGRLLCSSDCQFVTGLCDPADPCPESQPVLGTPCPLPRGFCDYTTQDGVQMCYCAATAAPMDAAVDAGNGADNDATVEDDLDAGAADPIDEPPADQTARVWRCERSITPDF